MVQVRKSKPKPKPKPKPKSKPVQRRQENRDPHNLFLGYIHPYISSLAWSYSADTFVHHRPNVISRQRLILYSDIRTLSSPSMKKLIQSMCRPFILVTSSVNSDQYVPHTDFEKNLLHNNSHLHKWYSKQIGVRHDKLIPLPLGPRWMTSHTNVKQQLMKMQHVYQKLMPTVDAARVKFEDQDKKKEELVFLKFNTATTNHPSFKPHKGERLRALTIMKQNFPDADYNLVPQNLYFDLLAKHKFVLSPPGNGIDCHRTWEALMVGTIPIVLDTPMAPKGYEGLPVVVVPNWNMVTKEFLEQKYEELHSNGRTYDWQRVQFPYWRNRIKRGT